MITAKRNDLSSKPSEHQSDYWLRQALFQLKFQSHKWYHPTVITQEQVDLIYAAIALDGKNIKKK